MVINSTKKIFFVSPSIQVIVVSYGGVGTSFLIDFISQYLLTNCSKDTDGLKHLDIPPLSLNPNLKVLYVYGDPVEAAISLFRRNYYYYHSVKLLRNVPHLQALTRDYNLSRYAEEGVDRLGLTNHFYNWWEHYPVYNTLFIRYESIWKNLDALFDFLNIPKESKHKFPKQKQRVSSKELVEPKTINELNSIYEKLNQKIKMIPDVTVVNRKRNGNYASHFFRYLPDYYVHKIGKYLYVNHQSIYIALKSK